MDDPTYRRGSVAITLGQHGLDIFLASDVEGDHLDRYATHLERTDRRDLLEHFTVGDVTVPVPPRRQRCTAGKYQATGAAVGEPGGHQQTECSHTSGDEVCRIGSAAQSVPYPLARHRCQHGSEEYVVTQHQDGLAAGTQHPGQGRDAISRFAFGIDIDQTAPKLRMLGGDDARKPPKATLPQRRRVHGFVDTRA